MHEFAASSVYFGVFVSLAAYFIGMYLRKKTGIALLNPLLVSVALVMALLLLLDIDYAAYNQSAKILSSLLTPATICLAVPLYEQLTLLKKHKKALFLGILSGVITSLVCVLALSLLLGLDHAAYVTLLPKSITTAIGMSVSQELGGHVPITIAVILLTGVLGIAAVLLTGSGGEKFLIVMSALCVVALLAIMVIYGPIHRPLVNQEQKEEEQKTEQH